MVAVRVCTRFCDVVAGVSVLVCFIEKDTSTSSTSTSTSSTSTSTWTVSIYQAIFFVGVWYDKMGYMCVSSHENFVRCGVKRTQTGFVRLDDETTKCRESVEGLFLLFFSFFVRRVLFAILRVERRYAHHARPDVLFWFCRVCSEAEVLGSIGLTTQNTNSILVFVFSPIRARARGGGE